jgi:hypothetical protein
MLIYCYFTNEDLGKITFESQILYFESKFLNSLRFESNKTACNNFLDPSFFCHIEKSKKIRGQNNKHLINEWPLEGVAFVEHFHPQVGISSLHQVPAHKIHSL